MDEAWSAQGWGVRSRFRTLLRILSVSSGLSTDAKEMVAKRSTSSISWGSIYRCAAKVACTRALCPWHDDSKPSLTVNQERQIFRCWVCNIGGDVFSFLMKHENVTFPEALQMLADRAGIKLATRPGESADAAEQKANALSGDGLGRAAISRLPAPFARGPAGPTLSRRTEHHARDDQSVALGRCAGSLGVDCRTKPGGHRYSPQMLSEIGVVGERRSGHGYYDRFKGRVLFSIRDAQARPVALGGRILPAAPTPTGPSTSTVPETPLFSKSSLVYGRLDQAKDAMPSRGGDGHGKAIPTC